jgi:hypothetical protein
MNGISIVCLGSSHVDTVGIRRHHATITADHCLTVTAHLLGYLASLAFWVKAMVIKTGVNAM